jgi:tryptophan-rich sensory protein
LPPLRFASFHARRSGLDWPKGDRVFRHPERPEQNRTQGAQLWALAGFIGLTLLVAVVASVTTIPNIKTWYAVLPHPPLTPPNGVFGPVWTVLYIAMAIAAWRIWRCGDVLGDHRRALTLWGWQLAVNAIWAPVFFGLHRPAIAIAIIAVLDVMVTLTILAFRRIDRIAAILLLPYLAWGVFATYLTIGFWWLNR